MLKVVVFTDLNILQDEIDTQQDAYYKSEVLTLKMGHKEMTRWTRLIMLRSTG
jgi:hypothetical protein